MAEIVNCPQCQRQLRVPEELLGKRVRCPSCNTTFTATPAGGAPVPGSAPAEPAAVASETAASALDERYQQESGGWEEEAYEGGPRRGPRSRQAALNRAKAPGICLLIAGILGLLANTLGFVFLFARGDVKPPVVQGQDPQAQRIIDFFMQFQKPTPVSIAVHVLFLTMSAFVAAGGLCMILGKLYPLAVAGSVIGIVNIANCCCILGLPFGIWSLVVLLNNEVKSAFG